MRIYGISTVSQFPWSLKGPLESIQMSLRAGFDGIQALPMRGWSYECAPRWGHCVISYEDAWNFGSVWQALLRTLHVKGEPAPTLLDLLLFGRKHSYYFPEAIPCTHHPEPGTVLEIFPDLWKDPCRYMQYAARGNPVCWDTLKVREFDKEDSWRSLLERIPGETIRLIHVHPKDTGELLSGKENVLTEMLASLRVKTDAPAILEVEPVLRTKEGTVNHHRNLLERTQQWLG